MIDQSRMGMRCRTTCFVRTVEGDLPRNSQGTIRCEMENLSRHLILVQWDQGFTVPVFPHEIEMCAEADARL
jgi:hypothetical protein